MLEACVAHENIDYLIAIGELAKDYALGAIEAGMDKNRIEYFTDAQNAEIYLKELIEPFDVVLFKGSRGMHLDKVIENIFEPAKTE